MPGKRNSKVCYLWQARDYRILGHKNTQMERNSIVGEEKEDSVWKIEDSIPN